MFFRCECQDPLIQHQRKELPTLGKKQVAYLGSSESKLGHLKFLKLYRLVAILVVT
jgi:hypothetical protein